MQTEQAHEKGLFEVLQALKILSVASAFHTPGPNQFRGISGLLRWLEWPAKPGPKFLPKFCKIGPGNSPKFVPKILGLLFTIRQDSQPSFPAVGTKTHPVLQI